MPGLPVVERRELVARVVAALRADPSRSSRSIARDLATTVATVSRHRRALAAGDVPDVLLDAGPVFESVWTQPLSAPLCGCGSAAWRDAGRCLRCGRDLPLLAVAS